MAYEEAFREVEQGKIFTFFIEIYMFIM